MKKNETNDVNDKKRIEILKLALSLLKKSS